jgi:hypothetical protein
MVLSAACARLSQISASANLPSSKKAMPMEKNSSACMAAPQVTQEEKSTTAKMKNAALTIAFFITFLFSH